MSSYSIKDLERISSMKAHTIRMWEQRYGLLEPERTDTNIRFYNDDQVKKLLNVCTLLDRGMKISRIGKLTKSEIASEIDKIIQASFQGDVNVEAIINQALIAITTYHVALFEELFANAVKRLGLKKTYTKILYPLLVRTGLMWVKDDLLPSQEHFLSNLIRQKLFAAVDALPLPEKPDQKWILFLNEEEDHEIGLLFAYYMARQMGQDVVYLGARVPLQDLTAVISDYKPTHVYSFFVRNQYDNQAETLLGSLRNNFPNLTICISGGDEKTKEIANKKGVILIETIENLTDILNSSNA
ncbi:MerR family transcriptional regulator [Dyadobacter chenwenxiniae]|uniref:MerR family transcriptional regulator n=1 Tax=Dyadobacter chenwenxiniae TaxID=2906456 RepID=A0A9X1PK73_9BACT|nr:MerR family transcriptional regulator [Dyadobacter chenwenxiniae]MCF0062296.1 MerR family transcriptional regulator [Dyadobacter chenwenxiniae]UON83948.1 MerR family transcriptional regulator [Dyadobacter chenwenxiniae]